MDASLPVVRLDIDPDEPARFRPPASALVGDAATVLRALLAVLPQHNRPRTAADIGSVRAWFTERLGRLEPQLSFLRSIRAALPDDGIFVEDVTQLGFVSRLALPITRPRTFLSPGYQDNLGWASRGRAGRAGRAARSQGAGDRRRRRVPLSGERARDRGATSLAGGRRRFR